MSRQPPARVWNRIYLVFVCSVGTERYQLTERQSVFFNSHRSERFSRSRPLQVVDVTPPLNSIVRHSLSFYVQPSLPRLSCLTLLLPGAFYIRLDVTLFHMRTLAHGLGERHFKTQLLLCLTASRTAALPHTGAT